MEQIRDRKKSAKHLERILILTTTYPRWKDDSEAGFVHEYARGMSKRFEVHVLAPYFKGCKKEEVLDGVFVHRFRYWFKEGVCYGAGAYYNLKKVRNAVQLPSFFCGQFNACVKLVKKYDIQLIHCWWLSSQAIVSMLVKKFYKIPYVITCAGTDISGKMPCVFNKLQKDAIQNADAVVGLSSWLAKQVVKKFSVNFVRVIPLGVDFKLFKEKKCKGYRYGVLGVGRLTPQKRFLMLAKVCDKMKVALCLVGDGPERKKIEKYENVIVSGFKSHEDLVWYYSSAEVFVLPSKNEALGMVIAEAMACKCPVIATDSGGIPDLVIHKKTGLLFKGEKDLRRQLEWLYNHPKEKLVMVANAYAHIKKNYSWDKITKEYSGLLKEVYENGRN